MATRAAMLFRAAAISAALILAGCDASNDDAKLASLDNEIVGNDADPALTSALEDQILVDPALTQQSNKNAVRPPQNPAQAQYPLPAETPAPKRAAAAQAAPAGGTTTAAPTARAAVAEESGTVDCAAALDYNAGWARRLPAGFAVYPGARLGEVAGTDRPDCRARVVTFRTAAAPDQVLEWYRSRAAGAGYSAERQARQGDQILAGRNAQSGGAYYLILTPVRAGGSEVALIVNGG